MKWHQHILLFVNYFSGFVKKEYKTQQLWHFAGFYQRKLNGIKRFCGAKTGKKKRQALQHSCFCEHGSGCHIAFHCENHKGKSESPSTSPLLSIRWITKLSVEHGITLHLSAPLHVALEHESIYSRGKQKQSVGSAFLMLVGVLSCY